MCSTVRDAQPSPVRSPALARPDAKMLLLAFQPNTLPFVPDGISQEDIEQTYADWDLIATEPADVAGMPKPIRKTAPRFYTLHLR